MPDQVSPPFADTPPTEQQGPTSWAAAGAAATGQPADNSAQQALAKAQNPDRSQVQPESPTSNAGVGGGVPLVLRPKRTGLAGVIGKIADVLTGTTRPEIFTDQNGDEFVYHPNLSRGQQWMRIGGDAFRAAGAGLAAGKGAGNMGRAMVAGTDVARDRQQDDQNQEQQMDQKANQDMLNRANMTILRMNMIEQSWRASRLQIEANEHDAAFSQNRIKFFQEMGGKVLTTAEHPGDLAELLHINPDTAADFVRRHIIEPVPTIDANGHQGVTFIKMPTANWRDQFVSSGATFHTFNPSTHEVEEHQAADGMTKGDQSDADTLAQTASLKYQSDIAEKKNKDASTANLRSETAARDQELPGKIEETAAKTKEDNARADALKAGAVNPDGTKNQQFENLAQALYSGEILFRNLKREAKGMGLDPNALAARAVEIGKERGVPWSETIIDQEFEFAKNEKTQAALDGIDRIIDPKDGYLQTTLDLAKRAGLGDVGILNAGSIAVRGLVGDKSAKNLQTAIAELRRSISGLIGNPLLGGGETDKKLEQSESLIGKSPTMANLNDAANILTTALASQKNHMVGNNRFLQKRYAQPAAQPQPVKIIPGEPMIKYSDGSYGVVRNGQWTPAQQ
jgi:hypothetical protein